MEYRDKNWKKSLSAIKIDVLDLNQQKAYKTDGMNNKANNTDPEDGGNPYPELLQYWNFYHTDETIQTNWIFFTYIDNLSSLGGLINIGFLGTIILMRVYSFRLNEINVFFF